MDPKDPPITACREEIPELQWSEDGALAKGVGNGFVLSATGAGVDIFEAHHKDPEEEGRYVWTYLPDDCNTFRDCLRLAKQLMATERRK